MSSDPDLPEPAPPDAAEGVLPADSLENWLPDPDASAEALPDWLGLEFPESEGAVELPASAVGPVEAAAPLAPSQLLAEAAAPLPEAGEAPLPEADEAPLPEPDFLAGEVPLPEFAADELPDELPGEPPLRAAGSPGWSVERITPRTDARTSGITYGVNFRNAIALGIDRLHIEHEVPAGFDVQGTSPRAVLRGRKLVWLLDGLSQGDQRRVLVRVVPRPGHAVSKAPSGVFRYSYTTRREHLAPFGRPRVVCVVDGPESARRGETATVRVEVANHGEGTAEGLVLRIDLPPELEAAAELARLDLADVAPGEAVVTTFAVQANQAGEYRAAVVLESPAGQVAASAWPVRVLAPQVRLRQPDRLERRAGDLILWDLDVANLGTAPAQDLRVKVELPESVEVVSVEDHAGVEETRQARDLVVGDLDPGQSRLLSLRLRPTLPGDYPLRARAVGEGTADAPGTTLLTCVPNEALAPGLLESILPGAPERAGPKRRRQAAAGDEDAATQHLLFTLGGTHYAVPLTSVVEIARVPPVFPVPNTPAWLLGVVNLRGDIVSLVDLTTFLGLDEGEPSAAKRLLVARADSGDLVAGLVVDRLGGLRDLAKTPAGTFAAKPNDRLAPFVNGVEELDNRLLVRLDLDRLLSAPELRRFEAV